MSPPDATFSCHRVLAPDPTGGADSAPPDPLTGLMERQVVDYEVESNHFLETSGKGACVVVL